MATRFAVASGNWSNPAIWDNGALPVAGDFVYANGFTVTIDQNINVGFISNGFSTAFVPNKATPAMTSNSTPSGVVTASSFSSSNFPWLAFDEALNNYWAPTALGWLSYQFPSTRIIRRYAIYGFSVLSNNPRIWTFEGSNDGTTWTTVHSVSLGIAIPINAWYDSGVFANSTPYLYYRLNITATGGGGAVVVDFQMTESTSTSNGSSPNGTFTMPTAFNITCTHPNGIIFQGTVNTNPVLNISATSGSIILNSNIRGGSVATSQALLITGAGHNITVTGDIFAGTASNAIGISRNVSGTLNINGNLTGGTQGGFSGAALNNGASGSGTITILGSLSPSGSNSSFPLVNGGSCTINLTGNITGAYGAVSSSGGFYNSGVATINITGNIGISANSSFTGMNGILNVANANITIIGNIAGTINAQGAGISSSSGTLVISGTIIGGNITNTQGINQSGGTLTVVGNVTAGTNSPAIFSTGTSGSITGDIFASSTYPAVHSTSTTTLFLVNGSIYNNGYIQAIWAARLGITPNTTMVYRLATNTGAAYNFYPVGSTALGTPATTDVRNGVIYASGALTGTLVVPLASAVTDGVIFDNGTIGTAQNTAASFLAELAISTDPLAERLRNVSTVQTTGAQIAAYNV